MSRPIPLRADFDVPALRRSAKATKDAAETIRLLSLAVIYDGGSRSDAARIGGVTLQVDRKADYVLALKDNQGTLRDDVELLTSEQKAKSFTAS